MQVRALFSLGLTGALVIAGVPLVAQTATAVAPGSAQSAAVAKDSAPDVRVGSSVERRLSGSPKGDPVRVPVIVSFATPTRDGVAPSVAAVRSARSTVVAALPAGSYDLVSSFSRIPAVSLEIDAAGLGALRANPLVTAVNADQVISTTMSEANPLTGVATLHGAGVTGEGVTVGVIDTGVDSTGGAVHPALADDVVGQACFRTENDCIGGVTSAEDQHGHGTHVAGIITGPQGVAPNAGIYALKTFTTGSTSDTNILNALNHVIGLNAGTPGTVDVVNMSLGGDSFADQASCDANSTAYVAAFATLNGQGVPVFVATGNDGRIDRVSSPGCATGAIGVGSVGDATFTDTFSTCTDDAAADRVSCFSNATPVQGAGEVVDLLAPGCRITSTGLDGATGVVMCGTSMATPYAAGSGALVMEYLASRGLTRSPAQLEELLEESGVAVSDYRMPAGTPTFPRINPVGAIGSLAVAPGATVSPTDVQVSEDGGVERYTVRLQAQPGADVVVTPAGDADCAVSPSALTFTAADHAIAQTVEVSAVADGDVEGDHTCAITHTVTSADAAYDGLQIADVTGAVTDALRTEVTLTTPADGASLAQGAAVAADFACTDNRNGAGITSCVGTVAHGSPIDTSTAGAKSFTVTLVDALDRTTAVTHTYTVTPPPAGPPAGPTPPPATTPPPAGPPAGSTSPPATTPPPAGPTPPTARPDARIGKGRRGTLVGNDVFDTAVGQTRKATVRGSQRATFRVSLQNDGPVADRLVVTGGASANGFVVRYARANGTDITAAVVKGRFRTPTLRPGATYTVLVKVRRGARVGSSLGSAVTARSVAQPDQSDAVTFVTRRR